MLIEVFHDWKCADIRDKVYAVVGKASESTAIVPDYSQSAKEIYFAVQKKGMREEAKFCNLLSQVLGLSGNDLGLPGQDLCLFEQCGVE